MKQKPTKAKSVKQIIEKNAMVRLDLACGQSKQKGFIGMDVLPYPGVDIVHNATVFPWPIPSESIDMMVASHFLEHVPKTGVDPRLSGLIDLLISKKAITKQEALKAFGEHHVFSNFIGLLNEAWRVLKVEGQFAFVVPYYTSPGFAQDPTHTSMINEATMMYFDPEHESQLWNFYKPMPWKIEMQTFQGNGNMEVVISKRDITKYEKAIEGHLEK